MLRFPRKWPKGMLVVYSLMLAGTLALVWDRSGEREALPDAVPALAPVVTGVTSPGQPQAAPRRDGESPLPWPAVSRGLLRLGLPFLDLYPASEGFLEPVRAFHLVTWLVGGFRADRPATLLQVAVPALAPAEPADEAGAADDPTWPLLAGGVPLPQPESHNPSRPVAADRQPLVLIYHTHSQESFQPVLAQAGLPAESPYTTDASRSIVRVGEEVARALKEEQGIPVLHLRDVFDREGLTGAYIESEKGVMAAMERYPTARFLLDIHRDSSGREQTVTVREGRAVARVMFVLGMGNEHWPNPHWQANRAFGQAIARSLDELAPADPLSGSTAGAGPDGKVRRYPALVRQLADGDGDPWTFGRNGRFNQHLSRTATLIEIGGPQNTMAEELRAARLVAAAAARVIRSGGYQDAGPGR